jgi:endoglucanase
MREVGVAIDPVELLERLSNAFGPCGFEEEVRDVIRDYVEPLIDEVRVDTLGNLIATRHGADDMTLMIDAHMDEIGFMINWIEPNGFLRFTTIGGWDLRILPSHAMTIRADSGARVKGVIGTPPPHILRPEERERPFKIEDMFVDIGVSSEAEVRALGIHIGSPAVIHYPFERLNERVILGKGLDDRAGCAVLVKALEALHTEELDVTLVANFAVREETGLAGAQTAAFQIDPDLALVLEGTVCADVPGNSGSRQVTRFGQGPSITLMDGPLVFDQRIVRVLTEIAEAEQIKYQYKLPPIGGTDAGAIHRSRGGVLVGAVSMPGRYIHSPHTLMRLDDFEHAVALTTAFAHGARRALGG